MEEAATAAISASAAEEFHRTLAQELTEEEEVSRETMALEGKRKELDAWAQFRAFSPVEDRSRNKAAADT